MKWVGCVLALTITLSVTVPAHAQIPFSANQDIAISLSPAFPEAHTPITLTAQSVLYDLRDLSITWSVNDEVVAEGVGETSIETTTGALGEILNVTASIEVAGEAVSVQASIVPAEVDLLWEADSYVPPLYDGRPLPTAGSSIRLFAIPRLMRGGSPIPTEQIIFTWRRSGEVLGSASGRGRSSLLTTAPLLFGTDTFTVEATSADRRIGASASVRIETRDTEVHLYERHPLFGVLYHREFPAAINLTPGEVRFIAVPFFAPVESAQDAGLEYRWTVNQERVENDAEYPNELIVDASESSGLAIIGLELTHARNYFLEARRIWRISFGASGGVPNAFDPFGASRTQ